MHRLIVVPLLAACALLGAAGAARATEYQGWGDTGWIYASKRECCNQAIAIAAQYSAAYCVNAGGNPTSFVGGGQRGSCSAQWQQDASGALMYRCSGESSVWCR